jgi:signal transduction histidine kinase
MDILNKIPTFLTVAVLVIIFVCLKRHARNARLTLWAVGWTMVFIHFLAQLLEPANGSASALLFAVDTGSLQAAAVAFLVSVSSVGEDRRKRTLLLLAVGVPAVAYAVLYGYDVQSRSLYVLCLLASFGGGITFAFWVHRRLTAYLGLISLSCTLIAAWSIRAAFRGSFDEGSTALLGVGFLLPAIFICRNYWRPSPAVLTIVGGFFCWAAVFPLGLLVDRFGLIIPAELWNTPKLFVAFGMILAVVEDKSQSIARMQNKAQLLNRQLERFSAITSRLLSGARVDALCPEIATAITEVSNFQTAIIALEDVERKLTIAGASGLSQQALINHEARTAEWTTDEVKSFCCGAERLAQNSFVWQENQDAGRDASICPDLLIPLRSAGGAYLGYILLGRPRNRGTANQKELSRIELLAADLAVAVELKALNRQLVSSEKLAALGQLVAGVAHELNNPLAVIMGYGELMGDEITAGRSRDQLDRIVSESRRMKRIIDNLLRFSRQSSRGTQAVQLAPVLQEVLALREYYMRTHNVKVEVDISSNLLPLAINEDELKQILLNLLNNASDALDGYAGNRLITIRATQSGNRATVEVQDSGPGFANLNRALDPFYTTKPVGKGTGLGLSVCYGIVKEYRGDLRIENVEPQGARVVIELPVAEHQPIALAAAAVAHA